MRFLLASSAPDLGSAPCPEAPVTELRRAALPCPVLIFSLLGTAFVATAAAPASAVEVENPAVLERYAPIVLESERHPEVDERLGMFFLGGLLPFGQVYLPLIDGGEYGDGYLVDAGLIALVHLLPHVFLFALIVSTPLVVIPFVGWILVAMVYAVQVANILAFLVNNFYCTPVAVANEANRHALGKTKETAGGRRSAPLVPLQLSMAY